MKIHPGILGSLVVLLSGAATCVWSWGTWPDPVIDFGREVYVPWRQSEGEVLYRDVVSYFNGPLSPYAHALLFELCGASLRILVLWNLLLVGLLAAILYRLISAVAGHLAATAAGITFFVLFAFARLMETGNYNYVCPYSYELPHGITLSAAGIVLLGLWMREKRRLPLLASGVVLGLVFLTKAEVFLAAALGLGSGVAATLTLRRSSALRDASLFLGGALLPPMIALSCLCLVLPAGDAWRGILGAWRFLGRRELIDLPYFRELAGTDDVGRSLEAMLRWSTGYLLVFVPAAIAGWLAKRRRMHVIVASLSVFLLVVLALRGPAIDWGGFLRPAPLILLALVIVCAVRIARRRDERMLLPLVLSVWALALLAKMPLNAHVFHYGFALAMPATLMVLVALVGWLPGLLDRAAWSGWPLRAAALGALTVVLGAHALALKQHWGRQTHVVGSGLDRFYADERGPAFDALVAEISRTTAAHETLVMIPEGLLVNYLARRRNPTGQLNFTPAAIAMYGEDAFLRVFQEHPPDRIVILNIDTSEYGARLFGEDYAQALNAWIERQYERLETPHLTRALRIMRRRRDPSRRASSDGIAGKRRDLGRARMGGLSRRRLEGSARGGPDEAPSGGRALWGRPHAC